MLIGQRTFSLILILTLLLAASTGPVRAFVYHGSAIGLFPTLTWLAERDQASAYFGSSVVTAGDVNGDGYSDVIVGAHWYDNGESGEGQTYVYHGSATGAIGP